MTTISLVPDDKTIADWNAGVAHLQRMLSPNGFPMDRWATICADCARLLEQHGADLRRLGWSTVDAFGVHPEAPVVAVRCYGLGLLLNGGKVFDLTEQRAGIKLPSGAQLTFSRAPRTGAVPIWTVR